MLRRSIVFLSGGHGDLFPVTKAGALTPVWLMGRSVKPGPGKNHAFVEVTKPEYHNQYQHYHPESHVTKSVDLSTPKYGRPSEKKQAAFVKGITNEMTMKKRVNDSSIATANIQAKHQSEVRMKARNYTAHKRPQGFAPGWEKTIPILDCCEWHERRNNDLRKMLDCNKNGYTREYRPWDPKPPPPPKAPAKK